MTKPERGSPAVLMPKKGFMAEKKIKNHCDIIFFQLIKGVQIVSVKEDILCRGNTKLSRSQK